MELANCMVALGGNRGYTVPKNRITPAEILVLMAIHGEDAVFDIEPLPEDDKRSVRDELERIRAHYGNAKNNDDEPVIAALFPGAGARVPERLDDLHLDESLYKPAARMTTAEVKPKRRSGKKADEETQEPEKAVVADEGDGEGGEDPFN